MREPRNTKVHFRFAKFQVIYFSLNNLRLQKFSVRLKGLIGLTEKSAEAKSNQSALPNLNILVVR